MLSHQDSRKKIFKTKARGILYARRVSNNFYGHSSTQSFDLSMIVRNGKDLLLIFAKTVRLLIICYRRCKWGTQKYAENFKEFASFTQYGNVEVKQIDDERHRIKAEMMNYFTSNFKKGELESFKSFHHGIALV